MNSQIAEKSAYRDDGAVVVHSIIDTMQGEGPLAGTPATFLRLAGCNLQCSLCDTEYTVGSRLMYPEQILFEIKKLPVRNWVVITGGEPLRQNVSSVLNHLWESGRMVQIETNGTLVCDEVLPLLGMRNRRKVEDRFAMVVCSPKTPQIYRRLWDKIDALKYVIKAGQVDEDDRLPTRSVGPEYGIPARPARGWAGTIFVQPLDEQDDDKNSANLEAAVQSAMKMNYKLTVQMHKMLKMP